MWTWKNKTYRKKAEFHSAVVLFVRLIGSKGKRKIFSSHVALLFWRWFSPIKIFQKRIKRPQKPSCSRGCDRHATSELSRQAIRDFFFRRCSHIGKNKKYPISTFHWRFRSAPRKVWNPHAPTCENRTCQCLW